MLLLDFDQSRLVPLNARVDEGNVNLRPNYLLGGGGGGGGGAAKTVQLIGLTHGQRFALGRTQLLSQSHKFSCMCGGRVRRGRACVCRVCVCTGESVERKGADTKVL